MCGCRARGWISPSPQVRLTYAPLYMDNLGKEQGGIALDGSRQYGRRAAGVYLKCLHRGKHEVCAIIRRAKAGEGPQAKGLAVHGRGMSTGAYGYKKQKKTSAHTVGGQHYDG